ncbi:MAG: DUF2058 domain-containing protein [Kangiellaceae bacterium]|jgi:uncharacterized protein YaiL (DUF2058 family)|nr:DUF2058 domain-containing protein [Kangiellaceae bacterium]
MAKSLQEQLLGTGLVDKKRAQKIKTEKRKKAKQQPKGHKQEDEAKVLARKEAEAKAERDRELNLKRKAEQEQKEIIAQIKQLIESNSIDRSAAEDNYQFNYNGKVKQLKVTPLLRTQLAVGLIAIVQFDDIYHLVPKAVAEKIEQRDSKYIVLINEKDTSVPDEDDPYAEYQIPDDLMW